MAIELVYRITRKSGLDNHNAKPLDSFITGGDILTATYGFRKGLEKYSMFILINFTIKSTEVGMPHLYGSRIM